MSQILIKIHEDHRNYSILLSMLNADIEHLQRGESTDFIRLYDIMNYMTNYPDVSHHPIEEIMFRKLQDKTSAGKEQITRISEEHQKLAILGLSLKEKLHHVTSGAIVSKDAILEAALEYYVLLTKHINYEETNLFPDIEKTFTDDDRQPSSPK